jgi:hypothetical protein
MTNRFGRVVDKSRKLADSVLHGPAKPSPHLITQLRIFAHRARIIRLAITLATLSVLFAALLVITLFVVALGKWDATGVVIVLFIACLASLIGSLLAFLYDLNVSLKALELEVQTSIQSHH